MDRQPAGHAFLGPMLSFFKQTPLAPGAVDVVCSAGEPGDLLASAVLLLLGRVEEGSTTPSFPQVRIVCPGGATAAKDLRSKCADLLVAVSASRPVDNDLERLDVREAMPLNVEGLLAALDDVPRGAAVIVARATAYLPSDHPSTPGVPTGHQTVFGDRIRLRHQEDLWVDSLVAVAASMEAAAHERHFYLLLVTGVDPPLLPAAIERLQRIPGALFVIDVPRRAEMDLVHRRDDWVTAARRGRDESFFPEIDALDISELNRALVKAQCLFAAGRGAHAAVLLGPHFDKLQTASHAAIRVDAARIAIDGANVEQGTALATAALASDNAGPSELSAVVQIASRLELNSLGVTAAAELERRYPGFAPPHVVPANADPMRAAARLVVEALRRWALSVPASDVEDGTAHSLHTLALHALLDRVPQVFAYLSEHPEDGETRVTLIGVLDRECTGDLGAQFLIAAFVHAPPAPFLLLAETSLPEATHGDDEVLAFAASYDAACVSPRVISTPDGLPVALRGERCKELRPKILGVARYMAETLGRGEAERKALLVWTGIACDVADHCGTDGEAYEILGVAASALAIVGDYQGARDLAENALLRARGGTAGARRAAWCAFADAYARSHNPLEGALGWICAMRTGASEITSLRAVQEMLLRVRLLRDLQLLDAAHAELVRARNFA